jgi:F420-dependent oxidoreductase-like protein
MHVGLAVTNFAWPVDPAEFGPTLGRIAAGAEQAGFASFWVMDHFFQTPLNGGPTGDCPEAYTTLAFVAGRTSRMRLGTMVTGVTHRHPGVLVKTVTTLDVLSGGRANLGIGASWYDEEQRGLGIPVSSTSERFQRLTETLRIAKQMWAGDETAFEGQQYRLERPLNQPNSLSRPHPPILVGGQGEQRTFRIVARYADAANMYEPVDPVLHSYLMDNLPPDHPMRRRSKGGAGPKRAPEAMLTHKLGVLRERCAEIGRPYAELEKTTLGGVVLSRNGKPGTLTPAAAIERYQWLASLGVDHAIVEPPMLWDESVLELWAEVIAGLREIIPAGRDADVPNSTGAADRAVARSR